MIIDYQGILQDLIDITAQVNDQDNDFQTQIDALSAATSRLDQLISSLANDKLQSMIVATNKRVKNMEQQFYVG